MIIAADYVKGSDKQNPFSDSQARNFSDEKVSNEFFPISTFWTLFNDQHEILLGTRGSGKTFLLKMMRYSMLKSINHPEAKELTSQKKFLAVYVPMYLDFVTYFSNYESTEKQQIQLFEFAFNCLLSLALIAELNTLIDEQNNKLESVKTNLKLASELNAMWFDDESDQISDLFSLSTKIKKLFYSLDVKTANFNQIPPIFQRQIGASLLTVKDIISKYLNFTEEPTWIICIDEAEFLTKPMIKCINSLFRSDSNHIALKVATLPYFHTTLETLDPNISVSAGNDFNYITVDMDYNSIDFTNLTNTLCSHRIKTRFNPNIVIEKLEDFVGIYGNDGQIDYYRKEVGEENATYECIMQGIISEFPAKRKKNAMGYNNPRKTIYDKYAPIFYTRRMYALSKHGNSVPGWYAGSPMIRKISQGNPRVFIQIMNKLFEKSRKYKLTPKAQHGVIIEYVNSFCESTKALEVYGPTIYAELNKIADILKNQAHKPELTEVGSNFKLSFRSTDEFEESVKWIQLSIAYSRLIVKENVLKNGIKQDTEYQLANTYAAKYWLPMRSDSSFKTITIDKDNSFIKPYIVKTLDQRSFFDEESEQ